MRRDSLSRLLDSFLFSCVANTTTAFASARALHSGSTACDDTVSCRSIAMPPRPANSCDAPVTTPSMLRDGARGRGFVFVDVDGSASTVLCKCLRQVHVQYLSTPLGRAVSSSVNALDELSRPHTLFTTRLRVSCLSVCLQRHCVSGTPVSHCPCGGVFIVVAATDSS